MVSIRVEGVQRFVAAAAVFNENPDKPLKRELYKEFRAIGKPIGARVIREGAAEMPRRGGLAARVAASKMTQANSTTARAVGVALRFKTAPSTTGQSYDLAALDRGVARHPVFYRPGVRKVWRVTEVPAGAFTRPFEASRDQGAAAVVRAMETVAAEIAHRTKK